MLESRHVIGLFMAVVVLSGLFFTLGYVLGRNQTSGAVIADLTKEIESLRAQLSRTSEFRMGVLSRWRPKETG